MTRQGVMQNRYAGLCALVLRWAISQSRASTPLRLPSIRRDDVRAVEKALARRGRRQRFQKRFAQVGAMSAAAVVLLAVGWTLSRGLPQSSELRSWNLSDRPLKVLESGSGAVVVGGGNNRRPVVRGMTLEPGTGLVAPAEAEVRLGTSDGTVLTLEKRGELTVVEQTPVQRFLLRGGAVRARVAKLRANERFILTTDDAEVEVHGTQFRVSMVASDPNCGGGVRTRVSVTEGVVSIRSGGNETFVPAGAEWPESCSTAATEAETAQVSHSEGAGVPRETLAARRSHRRAMRSFRLASGADEMGPSRGDSDRPASMAPSVLAIQNEMFASAVRAKRHQHYSESVHLFSSLIDRYPQGPLLEGAMAERMRLLSKVDHAAAARAASAYVARFPDGFARGEAQRLADANP